MPVIILNSSPERWLNFPVPLDAMLIVSRMALAKAISFRNGLNWKRWILTTTTWGTRPVPAIGAMSRMKL